MELLARGHRAGQRVVRLHTGDPAIYGAIREQMQWLDKVDIPYLVVPGVSSALPRQLPSKGTDRSRGHPDGYFYPPGWPHTGAGTGIAAQFGAGPSDDVHLPQADDCPGG